MNKKQIVEAARGLDHAMLNALLADNKKLKSDCDALLLIIHDLSDAVKNCIENGLIKNAEWKDSTGYLLRCIKSYGPRLKQAESK